MAAGEQNSVSAGQWTISDNGQQLGPYTLDQMKQMVREGRMPAGGLVWTPGMAEWRPWRQTPELELMGVMGGWTGPLRQASKGQVVDYLVFRRMVLPLVMQVVFWLGLLALVFGCFDFFRMAWGASDGFVESTMVFFMFGLGFIVLAFFWRCMCEVMILFYRINETLTDVKDAIERQGE
jgi:hypothetical protein